MAAVPHDVPPTVSWVEPFSSMLATGGRSNSLGRSGEVVELVLEDAARLAELYACMSTDDAWVRMRAADAFEKICRQRPEWVEPWVPRILTELTSSDQPSVQWHLAQVFAEVTLTPAQRDDVIEWLRARLRTADGDWIVVVNAMTTLLRLREHGGVGELEGLFETQQAHRSATVRRKAAGFLATLREVPHNPGVASRAARRGGERPRLRGGP